MNRDSLGALTPYDLAMEEVTLAVFRLVDALVAHDLATIEQECAESQSVHRSIVELYPTLQLTPTQRDSLLAQLALLRSQLEKCETEPPQRIAGAAAGDRR
jgi:hypothetical protein